MCNVVVFFPFYLKLRFYCTFNLAYLAYPAYLAYLTYLSHLRPRIPIIVIPQECKPDQAIIAALEANGTSWVDEKLTLTICTNENTDNRRSFPSGHASQVRQLKYNDFKCFLDDLGYYSLIIYTICDDL